MVRRLLERDVVVQPNTRVFKALRNQMTEILTELRRIENGANVYAELLFHIILYLLKTKLLLVE